jgi:hypothetical protein
LSSLILSLNDFNLKLSFHLILFIRYQFTVNHVPVRRLAVSQTLALAAA